MVLELVAFDVIVIVELPDWFAVNVPEEDNPTPDVLKVNVPFPIFDVRATVPVVAGRVNIVVPAIAVGVNVIVPDVAPGKAKLEIPVNARLPEDLLILTAVVPMCIVCSTAAAPISDSVHDTLVVPFTVLPVAPIVIVLSVNHLVVVAEFPVNVAASTVPPTLNKLVLGLKLKTVDPAVIVFLILGVLLPVSAINTGKNTELSVLSVGLIFSVLNDVIYGKAVHTSTPFPIFSRRVSVSNPLSPELRIGFISIHCCAVPRLI
jgi:hypothetical protein